MIKKTVAILARAALKDEAITSNISGISSSLETITQAIKAIREAVANSDIIAFPSLFLCYNLFYSALFAMHHGVLGFWGFVTIV